MATSTLLERVKVAIRRSHNKLDDDLQADINACLQDMTMRGIVFPSPNDPLVIAAVKLYCRSTTTDDPQKAAQFYSRYESLRDSMLLSSQYTAREG